MSRADVYDLGPLPAGGESDGELLASLRVDADPGHAGVARRFADVVLSAWGAAGVAEEVELMTAELVANAILHAKHEDPVRMALMFRQRGSVLRVEMHDEDREPPAWDVVEAPVDPWAELLGEHGRGLRIVRALAERHGSRATTGGKCVWFEITAWPYAQGPGCE